MDDIEDFIKILSDESRIVNGGDDIVNWALELMELCFRHRNVETSTFGGRIVPQFGKSAGNLISFENYGDSQYLNIAEIINLLDLFWSSQHLKETVKSHVIHDKSSNKSKSLISSTLAHGFDRPIGLIWVVGDAKDALKLKSTLEYSSLLISLCIKNQKACKAIDLISQPLWMGLDTSEELFEYSAQVCFESISCRAVSIWLIEGDILASKYSKLSGSDETLNLAMRLGEGIAGRCAKINKSFIIDNLLEERVKHEEVVKDYKLYSGIFIPIHTFKNTSGVFAVYGSRINAFSQLDLNIASSIVQWLNIKLTQDKWVKEVTLMKKKIDLEMPLIETGILAMSKIHDAKNQLNFAQAQLSYLTTWFYKKPESEIYTIANTTSNYIDQVQEIITDLVQRSNLDKKNLKKTSLNKLIIGIIESQNTTCLESKIKIDFKSKEDCFPLIDKRLIKRVLLNLFDNSIHFLESVARKRMINIEVKNDDHWVNIKFMDNGGGIYEKDIDKIFDVFYTTKGEKGMGFGLSIVKKIIENHGGSIKASSIWGECTEFNIRLPLI